MRTIHVNEGCSYRSAVGIRLQRGLRALDQET